MIHRRNMMGAGMATALVPYGPGRAEPVVRFGSVFGLTNAGAYLADEQSYFASAGIAARMMRMSNICIARARPPSIWPGSIRSFFLASICAMRQRCVRRLKGCVRKVVAVVSSRERANCRWVIFCARFRPAFRSVWRPHVRVMPGCRSWNGPYPRCGYPGAAERRETQIGREQCHSVSKATPP